MLKNALLQQAQAKIEEGVTNKDVYQRLVSAGTKIIYNEATFKQLSQGIADSETPTEDIANLSLCSLLGLACQAAKAECTASCACVNY